MFTIVKLDAINSTNSYIKDLTKRTIVKNATVVVAKNQHSGRGQQKQIWYSESGKNLTFSLLYRFKDLLLTDQFYLNCAVSLAIYEVIFPNIGNDLSIKWPNDIMSANKKLGGILIENNVKNSFINQSIIGIGLNVNQQQFPEFLPDATSLSLISKKEYNLDILLNTILSALTDKIKMVKNKAFDKLYSDYHKVLYKKDVRSVFRDNNSVFNGKIKEVNLNGTLQIELENGELKSFANKTIHFL